jgi:hypothetical protein
MMPSSLVASVAPPVETCARAGISAVGVISAYDILIHSSLHLGPIAFLPQESSSGVSGMEARVLQVRGDDRSSCYLCLYTLLGLGLCRSVPLVRKMSWGNIPGWYQYGIDAPTGYSQAPAPGCRHGTVACCLRTGRTQADTILRCYRGLIAALLRKSFFTPNALACRGPPLACQADSNGGTILTLRERADECE